MQTLIPGDKISLRGKISAEGIFEGFSKDGFLRIKGTHQEWNPKCFEITKEFSKSKKIVVCEDIELLKVAIKKFESRQEYGNPDWESCLRWLRELLEIKQPAS